MNREIKFRVWDKVIQSMCYKVLPGNILSALHGSGDELTEEENLRYVLQQFTGLKDKNGADIYEGDVLRVKGFDGWKDEIGFRYQATVFYDELQAKFVFAHKPNLSKTGSDFSFWLKEEREIEVIGNIFENPELCLNSK